MRPGEIFALKWGRLRATVVKIRQRVYRGDIDTPKTPNSVRDAAISDSIAAEIELWRTVSVDSSPDAWVFPSEKLSVPIRKDNCWRRKIKPKLKQAGVGWVAFQVLRRTHSGLLSDPRMCP